MNASQPPAALTFPAARTGAPTVVHEVTPTADGLRAVRALVRETLQGWTVDARSANAAVDVAHELVSNAVQHGRPPVRLMLSLDGAAIDVTVTDGSSEPARRLPYRSGVSERGLGLRLVAQLSRAWGQRADGDGKAVWATVHVRAHRDAR